MVFMPNISALELQALNGFLGEIVRLAQAVKANAPQCTADCERIERQGQAELRVLNKIQGG
jgi:hypothetical protein